MVLVMKARRILVFCSNVSIRMPEIRQIVREDAILLYVLRSTQRKVAFCAPAVNLAPSFDLGVRCA